MKKLKSLFWFLFLIIYLELIYKFFVFNNLFSLDTLVIIFFSIPISILLYFITNIYSERINHILSIILSFLITILFMAQLVYYAFYESIFSVFSLTTGTGQVLGFFSAILDMMGRNWYSLILMLIPTLLFAIFGHKIFSFKRFNKFGIIFNFITMVLLFVATGLVIYFNDDGMYSYKRLYNETHAPILTVNKMGLLTMERLDLKRFIFGFEEKLWTDDTHKEEVIIEEKVKYNMLDIDFGTLLINETDETVKSMHEYFSSVQPTEQNDYTGMFKDKNLIYITAEGLDTIAISEELTPTLYKMSTNGFVFNNYYQPLFTVSTSDGEYMFMNSLIPKEGVWSMYRSSFIDMPFALGNMFSKLGYVANAWHDHSYAYYDRNLSHPNMGFNYVGCGNGLEKLMNCKIWPESDIEMIDVTYQNYVNEEKFLTYYMTVSGHLNYTFTGNSMSYKNRALVSELPYSNNVKAYIAANIEFDRAMEKLLSYLEASGKLDDTLIVISPDHYPYGLKESEINEVCTFNRDDKFDLYKTTLIMYNSAIEEPIYVDKYVSSIDVLPTVYNLFGVPYDSRLLMGRDIFAEGDGLVIYSDRSWITGKGKYDAISETFTPFVEDVPDNYVDKINSDVYQKFTMSSLILTSKNGEYINYYGKLGL